MEDGGRGNSFPLTLVPYNSLTVAVGAQRWRDFKNYGRGRKGPTVVPFPEAVIWQPKKRSRTNTTPVPLPTQGGQNVGKIT